MTPRPDHAEGNPGDDRPVVNRHLTPDPDKGHDPMRQKRMASPIPDDEHHADLTSEEEVLRQLLLHTVEDLRPAPGTLDHLRKAVPARRAHRRQALIGAAASLLLAVAAVPAVIHTANAANDSADRQDTSAAKYSGHGGKSDLESGPTRGPGDKPSGGQSQGKDGKGSDQKKSTRPPERTTSGTTAGADPSDPADQDASSCSTTQLDQKSPSINPANADGKIYGSFRVVNVSEKRCLVDEPGQLTASAKGSADASRIQVATHSPGGPAGGLPDAADASVVLEPGGAYLLTFGWVPESGTTGCTEAANPDGGGAAGETSGVQADSGAEGGDDPSTQPPGSVALTYTPDAGGPVASGQLDNVCAGTVYYVAPVTDG